MNNEKKSKIIEGPTWDQDAKIPPHPELNRSIEADIAVIGGGLAGMTSAYLLSKAGKKVVLIEKYKIGFGATGVTTALLTSLIDTDLRDLIKIYGKKNTSLILDSHSQAINLIEKIIKEHHIQCEFVRCPNYFYSNTKKEAEDIMELEKTAKKLNLDAKFIKDDTLGFKNSGFLQIENQAKFHPLKYLSSLTKIARDQGVEIYEKTEVIDIKVNEPFTIKINPSFEVKADYVIQATYSPLGKKLFFKKAFYDSYVIEAKIETNKIPEGIYEDNLDPYHYIRVDKKGQKDRFIIGGEDHRSDVKIDQSKNFQALQEYTDKLLSGIKHETVRKWSGPIIESVDGLAYIGEHEIKNMFYATAFSGNGMTYSTIAGMMVTDAIMKNKNPFQDIYSPLRKPTLKQLAYKGRDYVKEFSGGALKNSLKYRKKKDK